jgi:hypothetical protein
MEMEDDIKKSHALINHKKSMVKKAKHELLKLCRKKGGRKQTSFPGTQHNAPKKGNKGDKSKNKSKRRRNKPDQLARGRSSEGGKTTKVRFNVFCRTS